MAKQGLLIPIANPGKNGLNKEARGTILDPIFGTRAQNAVVDSEGRIAVRKGSTESTTMDIASTPDVENIHEYVQQDGTLILISSWNGGIGTGLTDPDANQVSSSTFDDDGHIWFQDFNNKVLAFTTTSAIFHVT